MRGALRWPVRVITLVVGGDLREKKTFILGEEPWIMVVCICERDLHACSRRFGRTLDGDGPAFP